MISNEEKPFYIDGEESWIHCLKIDIPKSYIESNPPMEYHYHEYIEMLYSLHGEATVWINEEGIPFNQGDLVIVNSETLHHLSFKTVSEYIVVKFMPQILYMDEKFLFDFKYVLPFIKGGEKKTVFAKNELSDLNAKEIFTEIYAEWEGRQAAYDLVIRSDILKVFSYVIRKRLNGADKNDLISYNVKRAVKLIGDNYATIDEEKCAEKCGLSYNYFSYLFKEKIGMTFTAYLNKIRIKRAKQLIVTTDKSMTEIAFGVGFSSSSHFISCFKRETGKTPLQFKKQVIKSYKR